MSVWKKIKSDVLANNTNKNLLLQSLKDMDITFDESVKKIKNSWGHDTCDGILVKNGRKTTMGLKFTANNGVELVGDIWGSGLGRDGTQEQLMDKISHHYQINNIKKVLSQTSWFIENEYTESNKRVIEITQY